MLVVEDGNRPAVLLEDVDHLLEKVITRIKHLAQLVAGIFAVLADTEDRVDREFVSAAAERLGNRRVDLETEFLSPAFAQIVVGSLVDVGGHDLQPGFVPCSVHGVTNEKSVAHVLSMALEPEFGGDDGQFLSLGVGPLRGRTNSQTPRTKSIAI